MSARRGRGPLVRVAAWVLQLPPWWVWASASVLLMAWWSGFLFEAIGGGAAFGVVVAIVWASRRFRRPVIVDWRDAERATAAWLRQAGCRRVELTGAGADAGIDVLTADWAVQVKHTARRVGRPAVQQLVGAALSRDRRSALFSTSGFSAPAVAYADEHQVGLFELDLGGGARPLNRAAHQVGRRFGRLRG